MSCVQLAGSLDKDCKTHKGKRRNASLRLQTSSDLQQAQQIRLGMGEGGPQLFPGALSAAVTAAMHAVPSGSIYWGDAAVQTGQDMPGDSEGLQHEGALQPQLTSQGVSQSYEPVFQSKHAVMLTWHSFMLTSHQLCKGGDTFSCTHD